MADIDVMEEDDLDTTIALPYSWGKLSEYVVVKPVTKEEKRDAKKEFLKRKRHKYKQKEG